MSASTSGEGRRRAQLPLQDVVSLAEGERADQERLVDAREPGPGGGVIEVCRVGGSDDRGNVQQHGHRSAGPADRTRRVPTSRPTIRRESSERRPCVLRPTPMKESGGAASCAER